MRGADVRVALLAPQYGADARDTLRVALVAEEAGLEVWLAGQMMPMPASDAETALEPLSLLGAIAGVTSRCRLGFMALAAPYLPPLYLAKALVTLDEISGGRIEVGLGAGWRKEEFDALGIEFEGLPARLARVEAALDALEELSGDPPAPGEATRWPIKARSGRRPRPPVWIAGTGSKILALAARRAQWTNFARGISVAEFRTKGREVEEAASVIGRRDPPGLSLTATFMTGEDLEDRLAERAFARGLEATAYKRSLRERGVLVGDPEAVASQMAEYIGAGCRAFVLWPLDGRHELAARELGAAADALQAFA